MQIIKKDAVIKCTNIFDDTFNLVIGASFNTENAYRKIDEIIKIFQNKNLPFSWWIGPDDTPANLKEILISKGFRFKENNYGKCSRHSFRNIK
jgi:hypothetical protein